MREKVSRENICEKSEYKKERSISNVGQQECVGGSNFLNQTSQKVERHVISDARRGNLDDSRSPIKFT